MTEPVRILVVEDDADPARGRIAGGAGLGLAIVRQLVLAWGGEVRAESPPGHERMQRGRIGPIAVRHPHQHGPLRCARGAQYALHAGRVQRQRALDEHVLPTLEGRYRHVLVPRIRRADDQGLDRIVVQDRLIVRDSIDSEALRDRMSLQFVRVGYSDYGDVLPVGQDGEMDHLTDRPGPGDRDADRFAHGTHEPTRSSGKVPPTMIWPPKRTSK